MLTAQLRGFKLCGFCERSLCPPPGSCRSVSGACGELESLLDDPELRDEAMEALRSILERVVATPRRARAVAFGLSSPVIWRGPGGQGFERKNPAAGATGFFDWLRGPDLN